MRPRRSSSPVRRSRRSLSGKIDHGLAVDLEHVEDVVDERAGALLHDREARSSLLVEGADLTVEDAVGGADGPLERPGDGREALGQVVAPPAREGGLATGDGSDRPIAVPLHLVEPLVAGRNGVGQRRQHRLVPAARASVLDGAVVLLAEEQPVLLVAVELRRHERPQALEALAGEPDGEAAVGLLLDEVVGPVVPDLDRAGAVLAGGDLALEPGVVERMVLDVHGEVALPGLERDPLGNGPARQGAVALEAEVVVEAARVVALDDEHRLARPSPSAERLGRLALAPFALVFPQTRHG